MENRITVGLLNVCSEIGISQHFTKQITTVVHIVLVRVPLQVKVKF